MLIINCSGTPFQIGFEHGRRAALQIQRGIKYYVGVFKKEANLDWISVCAIAQKFAPQIHERYPWIEEEMKAIAQGAGVKYEDVLALNLRMEIMFGLYTAGYTSLGDYTDGCTSLAWKTDNNSFVAQNWDWMTAQKPNVIILSIAQPGKPRFTIGVEAGIIGKIGLNSAGVGLCANGVRVKGVDYNRTPVHICMRLILESPTKAAAIAAVEKYGSAVSTHMLVADRYGAVGLECTTQDIIKLPMDPKGRVLHTNHLIAKHPGIKDVLWLQDSYTRIKRLKELSDGLGRNPSEPQIADLFKDEDGYPHSICRDEDVKDGDRAATLYNIVIDLDRRSAIFKFGRPTHPDEIITLRP